MVNTDFAFNKDDFLEDMAATDDKEFDEWLLLESKRITKNRSILYTLACAYFLILIFIFVYDRILVFKYYPDADISQSIRLLISLSTVPTIGIIYCFTKLFKNLKLMKKNSQMDILYQKKHSDDSQEPKYTPTALPEELIFEKSKICRAILRSKNKEEAKHIFVSKRLWRSDFSLIVLGLYCVFALPMIERGFTFLVISYLIYYLIRLFYRKQELERAKILIESRFINHSDSFSE